MGICLSILWHENLLRIESPSTDFSRVQIFLAPQRLQPKCLLSRCLPQTTHIQRRYPVEPFFTKVVESCLDFRRNRMIFHHRPERYYWPTQCFSKAPFKEVLNISQITIAYHGTCLPLFIQTGLQQYRGCPFYYPAYCPLSNTICLGTMSKFQ